MRPEFIEALDDLINLYVGDDDWRETVISALELKLYALKEETVFDEEDDE